MYDGDKRDVGRVLHAGKHSLQQVGSVRGCDKNIPYHRQGRAMILFHRLLFAAMLIVAFFQGAMDAGRRDLLQDYMSSRLLHMSLSELGQVSVM